MSQDAPAPRDARRVWLGIGVVVLGAAAAVTWWQGQPETASVLLRSGILLAAVWLAFPALRATRWGVLLAVASGAVLLLTRWRLVAGLLLGVLALAVLWNRWRYRGRT